jgi:opacity protein-like surface antigen
MIRQLLRALLLMSLIPAAVHAQNVSAVTHRDWEITVFGGGSYLGDHAYVTPVTGSTSATSRTVGLSFATGSQLGFRIAESRWQHWGAIMEYSFSNQPLTFTNLADALPALKLGHSIHRISYDVAYYPLDRSYRLRPYAFAGSGVALFHVKGGSKELARAKGVSLNDPWKLALNWGGGVKYLIGDHIGVSFQFSDNTSKTPHYSLPPNARVSSGVFSPGFLPSGSLHNRLITVGFIYQWGSK